MFSKFEELLRHTNDKGAKVPKSGRKALGTMDRNQRVFGHFMFLMRSLMMRHSQGQVYRGTTPKKTLMSLPKKTERVVEVKWGTEEEIREYKALERKGRAYYASFRERHYSELGKYFLKLTQKLLPCRIACSGGPTPLEDGASIVDKNGNLNDGDDEETDASNAKRKRSKVKFSDFAFTSKVKALIEELTKARDQDPTCKY